MGPYKTTGRYCGVVSWTHTEATAPVSEQICGPTQGYWQKFIASCLGPQKEHLHIFWAALRTHTRPIADISDSFLGPHGSTDISLWADLWAHARIPADILCQLSGPTKEHPPISLGSSVGPYKTNRRFSLVVSWSHTGAPVSVSGQICGPMQRYRQIFFASFLGPHRSTCTFF